MIVPSFKEPAARASMRTEGYFVVPGLCEDLVPDLTAAYREMLAALPTNDPYHHCPMTGTNYVGDRKLRDRVVARVSELVAPRFATLVDDYRFLGAGFRVKQTGPESALPQHQDPSMVDEDRFWSINFIVPIVDTDASNGALRIVPGSHHVMPKYRSLDLEDRAETLGFLHGIGDQVATIPMRAGDAIFYFNSLLHGSGPNRSGAHRPVVLGTLVSRAAPMILYLRSPDDPRRLECYEVPDDYFNALEDFASQFKLRPTVGRRVEDVRDDYDRSAREIIAAIRAHHGAA